MSTSTSTTILSLDPGTKNFGYSVLEITPLKTRVLKSGRLFHTVKVLNKDLSTQVSAFSRSIINLLKEFDVRYMIAERYMSRRMGGVTIECVNAMLGILMEISRSRKVFLRVIPASQWKNEVNRRKDGLLDEIYADAKARKITPHTVDAVMIGLYGRAIILRGIAFDGLESSSVPTAISRSEFVDIGEDNERLPRRKRRPRR